MENWGGSPYRVVRKHYDKEVSIEEADAYFKEHSGAYSACFSGYISGAYVSKEVPPKSVPMYNANYLAQYKPVYIQHDESYIGSRVKNSMVLTKEIEKAYWEFFFSLLEELNEFMEIRYDEPTKIISVLPGKEKRRRVFMLLYLTKLRYLFELPFALSAVYSKFFKDDFPELTQEQIAYLLDVFILKSGSGHGIFRAFNGTGTVGEFKPFAQQAEEAQLEKYTSINHSGEGSILGTHRIPDTLIGKYQFPDSKAERYAILLTKKDEILEKCFKIEQYEKSVSSL